MKMVQPFSKTHILFSSRNAVAESWFTMWRICPPGVLWQRRRKASPVVRVATVAAVWGTCSLARDRRRLLFWKEFLETAGYGCRQSCFVYVYSTDSSADSTQATRQQLDNALTRRRYNGFFKSEFCTFSPFLFYFAYFATYAIEKEIYKTLFMAYSQLL